MVAVAAQQEVEPQLKAVSQAQGRVHGAGGQSNRFLAIHAVQCPHPLHYPVAYRVEHVLMPGRQ